MTRALTRRTLVQRGAAGITLLSLPGLLAACGGGGGGGRWQTRSRTCSSSRTGRSTSTTTRRPRSTRHSTQFTAQSGIKVDYFEDINSNSEYFGKIQGPLSQGQGIDRDIIVLTDNERFLGLMIDKGWVAGARQGQDPEHREPDRRAGERRRSTPTATYSLPWQSGMTGIAWNEDHHRAGDVDHAALRGLEAEGQGDGAERDGRRDGPRHARQRRRPGAR